MPCKNSDFRFIRLHYNAARTESYWHLSILFHFRRQRMQCLSAARRIELLTCLAEELGEDERSHARVCLWLMTCPTVQSLTSGRLHANQAAAMMTHPHPSPMHRLLLLLDSTMTTLATSADRLPRSSGIHGLQSGAWPGVCVRGSKT